MRKLNEKILAEKKKKQNDEKCGCVWGRTEILKNFSAFTIKCRKIEKGTKCEKESEGKSFQFTDSEKDAQE